MLDEVVGQVIQNFWMAWRVVFVHRVDRIDQAATKQMRPSAIDRGTNKVIVIPRSQPDCQLSTAIVGHVFLGRFGCARITRWRRRLRYLASSLRQPRHPIFRHRVPFVRRCVVTVQRKPRSPRNLPASNDQRDGHGTRHIAIECPGKSLTWLRRPFSVRRLASYKRSRVLCRLCHQPVRNSQRK